MAFFCGFVAVARWLVASNATALEDASDHTLQQ
jgi:hypothetical protein